MKYFLWLLRIVVGVLFIFSGLVKANDPMGLVYKMNEFFDALHMSFMMPWSFWFSVIMIAFEITCGVAVLIGYSFRLFATLLLLLNLFFTFLTGYALATGKVKECGCFGTCIKISSQATFYKDLILLALSLILFFFRYRVFGLFSKYVNSAIMILTVIFCAGIQWYALEHLPIVDCMPYKVGNNLLMQMKPAANATPDVIQSVFIYEKDGVKKEFTTENYPWQDSTWKFVDRKDKVISEGTGQPAIHDFVFTDSDGNDPTQAILSAKGYTFFWFVREPEKMRTDNMDRIHTLIDKSAAAHIPFMVLWSADKDSVAAYQKRWNMANVPFMTLDGTASETGMRTNPGLMLIKDGTVDHKWSYRDYPKDMSLDNDKLNFK